jgi:hypothetical protein
LFVPLLALEQDMSLSSIAVLFALMRLPALFGYVLGDISDKTPYRTIFMVGMVSLVIVFVLLGVLNDFTGLVITGIGLVTIITLLRPLFASQVIAVTKQSDAGAIT